jgi:two-component system chemotaxis sensor kinase CheA
MPADPYKYFRIEAVELVERLRALTLDFAERPATVARLSEVLRHAHTLKGAARVVRELEIADAAHRLEGILVPHRDAETAPSAAAAEAVVVEVRRMAELVEVLLRPPGEEKDRVETALELAPLTLRTDIADVEDALGGLGEAALELGTASGTLSDMSSALDELARGRANEGRARASSDAERRADEELERSMAKLRQLVERLAVSVQKTQRELEQVRSTIDRVRLVPVSNFLVAMKLAVQDVVSEQGKQVEFVATESDLRVDGQVLEIVQSALLHVVRNAVTHGIEPPEERVTLGKARHGRVWLTVVREDREIVFTCRDDGRGLDIDDFRRAAVARGMSDAHSLDASGVLRLLAGGGVSTVRSATAVAGRGVGLDVLRDAAARVGGRVQFENDSGRGFLVRLRVPVVAAAEAGLILDSRGQTLVLPLEAALATTLLPVQHPGSGTGHRTIEYGQRSIPMLSLSEILPGTKVVAKPEPCAVIVATASGALALAVDGIRGVRTVITRPLPQLAPKSRAISGAALNAAGVPELVLNPDGLEKYEGQRASVEERPAESLPVLVIDDSLTTRMLEQSILESAGYQVSLATSAEDAIEQARETRFGLFLVDVEMPGMSGIQFVAQTRADPRLKGTPAILVSSRSSPEDVAQGMEAGASAYITKDTFDQGELLTLIRKVVVA